MAHDTVIPVSTPHHGRYQRASGAILGLKTLELLSQSQGIEVHLVISRAAERTLLLEIDDTATQRASPRTHHLPDRRYRLCHRKRLFPLRCDDHSAMLDANSFRHRLWNDQQSPHAVGRRFAERAPPAGTFDAGNPSPRRACQHSTRIQQRSTTSQHRSSRERSNFVASTWMKSLSEGRLQPRVD